jgi:hypothetical protein
VLAAAGLKVLVLEKSSWKRSKGRVVFHLFFEMEVTSHTVVRGVHACWCMEHA